MKTLIRLFFAAAVSFCTPTGQAFAQDETTGELTLTPSSPWNLDMAEGSCALRRFYSDEGNTVLFEIRQFSHGDNFSFLAYSDELREDLDGLSYQIHPDAEAVAAANAFTVTVGDEGEGVSFRGAFYYTDAAMNAPTDDDSEPTGPEPLTYEEMATREEAVTAISLRGAFERDLRFEIGTLAAPMQMMRSCIDDLLTSWGIDPQAQRGLTRLVTPIDQRSWTRRVIMDYPREALRRAEQASVNLRLIVNAEGGVDACNLQYGVGDPVFEESACRALTRYARFEPALDADGNPIASFWLTNVTYSLN